MKTDWSLLWIVIEFAVGVAMLAFGFYSFLVVFVLPINQCGSHLLCVTESRLVLVTPWLFGGLPPTAIGLALTVHPLWKLRRLRNVSYPSTVSTENSDNGNPSSSYQNLAQTF